MVDVDLLSCADPYDTFHHHPVFPYRVFWYHAELDEDWDGNYGDAPDERRTATAYEANLISSKTVDGMHAPAIDIDMTCRLVQSRTLGHYHLYIDKPMPWWKYRIMLRVLVLVGIVEPGYYRASLARKQTFLRFDIGKWDFSAREIQRAELLQIARQTR